MVRWIIKGSVGKGRCLSFSGFLFPLTQLTGPKAKVRHQPSYYLPALPLPNPAAFRFHFLFSLSFFLFFF